MHHVFEHYTVMKENQSVHTILIRLFSGEASFEEKQQINNWLKKSDDNRKLFADLQKIWLSSGVNNHSDQYDLEKAILQFRKKIQYKRLTEVRKTRFIKIGQYAAIVLLFLSMPIFYMIGLKGVGTDHSVTTITCDYGDRTNIVLPDSTKVCLNSGSKLTFNNNFQKNGRDITLEGEAFFTVSKDEKHPFKVKTAEVEIEVLGTEFNLKAYPGEKVVSTTLVEGSLLIKSDNQQSRVKPNQKIIYSKETKKMALVELDDTSPETEWINGRMVFRNESLGELELKLERWFDVDIRFTDEQIKQLRFTGTLHRESILEALAYFNYSPYLDYKLSGNTIIFYTTKH